MKTFLDNNKEYYFYAAVGVAMIVNEIGLKTGWVCVTFPLAALVPVWIGLKVLRRE